MMNDVVYKFQRTEKSEKYNNSGLFRFFSLPVDASKAGEGQLEISINDGDVPNAVQVLGGGKCLVTYTPEQAITHEIEVTFNGEQVSGKLVAIVQTVCTLS